MCIVERCIVTFNIFFHSKANNFLKDKIREIWIKVPKRCYIVGLKDCIDKVSRKALFITLTCIVGDKGTCETEGFLQNVHVIVYCP